jgi:molybdate transport system substrate-binding protein
MTDAAAKITDKGAPAVASGESDLVVLPVSELLHAPGVDFVGVIPEEVQQISVFSAAMVAGSTQTEEAKRLIAFLRSAGAAAAIKRSGMEQAPKP